MVHKHECEGIEGGTCIVQLFCGTMEGRGRWRLVSVWRQRCEDFSNNVWGMPWDHLPLSLSLHFIFYFFRMKFYKRVLVTCGSRPIIKYSVTLPLWYPRDTQGMFHRVCLVYQIKYQYFSLYSRLWTPYDLCGGLYFYFI